MTNTELIIGALGARGVLSLSGNLPLISEGYPVTPLEELFIKSCDALRGCVKKLIDRKSPGELYKIFFDFEAFMSEGVIKTKRSIKITLFKKVILENTRESSFLAVDKETLKILKNVKKQRFIPSRNSKNITISKSKSAHNSKKESLE